MRSKVVRVIGGAAAVAVAVVLLVVLKDDGGGEPNKSKSAQPTASKPAKQKASSKAAKEPAKQKPTIPTIVVRDGKPVGGVAEFSFKAGEEIRFKVTSDVSDELHLHGYDISKEVKAGDSVSFDFPAEIEGIFELELEQRAVPIAELQVDP